MPSRIHDRQFGIVPQQPGFRPRRSRPVLQEMIQPRRIDRCHQTDRCRATEYRLKIIPRKWPRISGNGDHHGRDRQLAGRDVRPIVKQAEFDAAVSDVDGQEWWDRMHGETKSCRGAGRV